MVCTYQHVYAVLVLSLQVLKTVKCCIASGCTGTYSDEVCFSFLETMAMELASLANYRDGILIAVSQAFIAKAVLSLTALDAVT